LPSFHGTLDHNGSAMETWLLPEFFVNNGEALCPKLWKSLSMSGKELARESKV